MAFIVIKGHKCHFLVCFLKKDDNFFLSTNRLIIFLKSKIY